MGWLDELEAKIEEKESGAEAGQAAVQQAKTKAAKREVAPSQADEPAVREDVEQGPALGSRRGPSYPFADDPATMNDMALARAAAQKLGDAASPASDTALDLAEAASVPVQFATGAPALHAAREEIPGLIDTSRERTRDALRRWLAGDE